MDWVNIEMLQGVEVAVSVSLSQQGKSSIEKGLATNAVRIKTLTGELSMDVLLHGARLRYQSCNKVVKPACSKCSSEVNACVIPYSFITINDKQSTSPHSLS
jgi:hypothetical protein